MPTFRVTDPRTGRTVRLESADGTPPTEQELEQVFAGVSGGSTAPQSKQGFLQQLGQIRPPVTGLLPPPPLQDYPAIGARTMNAAAFGLPRAITERMGGTYPKAQSGDGQTAEFIGEAAGTLMGGPAKLASRVAGGLAPRLAGSMLGRAVTRGVEGALGGALSDVGDLRQEGAGRALAGAAGNILIPPAIRGVKKGFQAVQQFRAANKLGKALENPKVREEAVREVQQTFLKTRPFQGRVTDRFADRLAAKYPDRRVNLSEPLAEIQTLVHNNPGFKAALDSALKRSQKSPFLQSLFNQPDAAESLTLQEAREVRQAIGTLFDRYGYKFGRQLDDVGYAVQESYSAVRAKELEVFPELKRAYKAFSETANRLKTLRQRLTDASMENTIKSDFGGNAIQIEAAKKLSRKGYRKAEELRKGIETRKAFKRARMAAGLTVGGGALARVGYKLASPFIAANREGSQ